MKIVKGDTVLVTAGNHKGQQGKVLKVFPKEGKVIVEGVNFIKRHTRPSQKNQQGGILEKEAPIHASNLMVICPKCNEAVRIGRKILDDGKRVRVCKNCGEMLTTTA
ncbi:50S ribosomal protein L24 [candidate division KSB1 bacterium]|nr:MAG: 50S ribosomal protein L24 [candidate division KSB1 bacterium]